MSISDPCCGLQMPCENLTFCLQKDLLQDPTVMAWMRMNSMSFLALNSVARSEVTGRLAAQESYLDVLNTKLDDARRQVEAAYKVVADVLVEIKNANILITKSRAILAPIRCVPSEILSGILALVDPPEIPDRIEDITKLCCVSKSWYQAARLTPDLWSKWRVSIGDSYGGVLTNMKPPARMGEFLLESMPRQLDFKIISTERYSLVKSAQSPRQLLKFIFQSTGRFSRLAYSCESGMSRCLCSRILSELDRIPYVGNLCLFPCREDCWDDFDRFVPGPIHLGPLQSLSVGVQPKVLPRLHIPGLTDLLLEYMVLDVDDLINLASSMPNLLVLRFVDINYQSAYAEEPITPIRFKRLRDFHLTGRSSWESDPILAGKVIQDSRTLFNIYRYIIRLCDLGITEHLKPGMNVSHLEFELDSFLRPFCWDGDANEVVDWFAMMPNLRTMDLKWKASTPVFDNDDVNSLLAANILDSMWTSAPYGPSSCRRLKYLKCNGIPHGETYSLGSGTRTFLMTLENFVYYRCAERAASNRTNTCLVSLNWRHTEESPNLPDLVEAGWEEVKGLLDLMTDEKEFSDDDVTEASECTWTGEDLDFDWTEEIASMDSGSDVDEEEETQEDSRIRVED